MADSKLVKLGKFEEIVRCTVCLETYSFPKTLRCQHSFCISCLAKILRATLLTQDGVLKPDVAISITCPVCTSVHEDISSLNDLTTNFMVVQLLDTVLECHGKADDTPLCGCRKVAVYICVTCQRKYCLDCQADASRYCDHGKEHGGPTARHSVVGIHDPGREEEYKCTKHNIVFEYYCTVCEEPVCLDCFLTSHKDHKTTVISSVPQKIQKLSSELEAINAKNKADKCQLSKALTSAIKTVDDKQLEISEKFKQLHAELQNFLDTLFEKIDAFCDEGFTNKKKALARIAAEERSQLLDSNVTDNFVSFVDSKMSDHLLIAFQAGVFRSMLSHGKENSIQITRSKKQFIMTVGELSQASVEMDVVDLKKSMVKMFDNVTLTTNDGDRKTNLKTFLHREFEALLSSARSIQQHSQGAAAIPMGYKVPNEAFIPMSLDEVEIGMKALVIFSGPQPFDGVGTVRWKGKMEVLVGIELDMPGPPNLCHDGSCFSRRYFYCKRNHGTFAALEHIKWVQYSTTA